MTHLQALPSPHVPGDQLRENRWAVPASGFYTAAFPVGPLQASYIACLERVACVLACACGLEFPQRPGELPVRIAMGQAP